MHVHSDHESLHYPKTCPQPLTPRQARWFEFFQEYNLTLWYVSGPQNPAADACSRLTSRQLMDIENATCTRAFVVTLVEKLVLPEGESVDQFLHVLEDSFSHAEVSLQPYDHLYMSWKRDLTLTEMQNQSSNLTLSQPLSRRTGATAVE